MKNPIEIDYDERKYRRKTRTYESKIVSVTTTEDKEDGNKRPQLEKTTHEKIQLLLLKLGSELGLDVWVARNDRNREFNGENFQGIPSLRKIFPDSSTMPLTRPLN